MSVPAFGMSERDFNAALKKTRCAIIPVGSLEQHGNHLPVSTDSLIVEFVARLAAERVGAFVLPVITYGVSFEHQPMFNVSLRSSTLSAMICDACVSLAGNKIKEIIILNGHHGNIGALEQVAGKLRGKIPKGVKVQTVHYWRMMKGEFDHAGEVETSLVLAIAPELVRMDRAEPNSKELPKEAQDTSIPGSFPKITGNGVWGDPRKATAAKGEKMIKEITANLVKTLS
jgi:creatinine amidohydrolase